MKALRLVLVILALVFFSVKAGNVVKCYVCEGYNVNDIPKLCKTPIDCGNKEKKGECWAWYYKGGGFLKECYSSIHDPEDYCGRGEGGSWMCRCSKDNCNIKEKDPGTCTVCGAGWNATYEG